jgi:hypothetical protein
MARPRRRHKGSVTPEESAAVLAEYNPSIALAVVSTRGVPIGWPVCNCGKDVCPDVGHLSAEATTGRESAA